MERRIGGGHDRQKGAAVENHGSQRLCTNQGYHELNMHVTLVVLCHNRHSRLRDDRTVM